MPNAAGSPATKRSKRTLVTLRFFADAPQNASEDHTTGYRGFYYHFLDMQTGLRDNRRIELSSIDTTLLLGGVLFAQSYYDRDTPQEKEIRQLADTLYKRVDWPWMQARPPLVSMGWTPGGKFIPHDWGGDYDEANLLYILALGSPTHPLKPEAWKAWTRTARARLGHALRRDLPHLRADVRPPVQRRVDRLPRHPRRLHAAP